MTDFQDVNKLPAAPARTTFTAPEGFDQPNQRPVTLEQLLNPQLQGATRYKVIECPEARTANGGLALRYGEANIYYERMNNDYGVDMRTLPFMHGVPFPAAGWLNNGRSYVLDPDHDHLVFIPSRHGIMDNEFAEETYYRYLEAFFQLITKNGDKVAVTVGTPGLIDDPDEAESLRRWARTQALADKYNVLLVKRDANADRPTNRNLTNEALSEAIQVEFTPKTMLFVGTRRTERNTNIRIQVQRQACGVILDVTQPEHVVMPVGVGMPLAMAEVCVERNIPLTLVYVNRLDDWAPHTKQRLDAVIARTDLVKTTGVAEFTRGRIPRTVQFLDQLATQANAMKIVVDDPAGSEARHVRNAKNFWPQVKEFMTNLDASVAAVSESAQALFKAEPQALAAANVANGRGFMNLPWLNRQG